MLSQGDANTHPVETTRVGAAATEVAGAAAAAATDPAVVAVSLVPSENGSRSAQKCCDVCVSVRSCLIAVSCMLQMIGWFGFWKCLGNGSVFFKIVRIDSSGKCGLVVSYQCGTGSLDLDWCCANHLGTFQSPEVFSERIS